MAFPKYLYGDPCEILERKQERDLKKSCTGCIHSYKLEFKSGIEWGCDKGKRFGKRCHFYEVKND